MSLERKDYVRTRVRILMPLFYWIHEIANHQISTNVTRVPGDMQLPAKYNPFFPHHLLKIRKTIKIYLILMKIP